MKAKLLFTSTSASDWSRLTWDGRIEKQFAIQYMLNGSRSETTLFSNDYFVHFLPDHKDTISVIPRHLVFVIDTSGSTSNTTIRQTRDVMERLIQTLKDTDHFNIITCGSGSSISYWPPSQSETYRGTTEVKQKAVDYVRNFTNNVHGTNTNAVILAGIDVVKIMRDKVPGNTKPMIFFMTEGKPSKGEKNLDGIRLVMITHFTNSQSTWGEPAAQYCAPAK
jgi:hypothetical protein